MAIQTLEVPTTIGMLEVDINEVDKKNVILSSENFIDTTNVNGEFKLVRGYEQMFNSHYVELRTKNDILLTVFDYPLDVNNLTEIVEFIISNS